MSVSLSFLPLVIHNYHLTVFLFKKVTSGELHLLIFHLLSTCLSLPSSSITFLRKCCRQRSSNHLWIILSTGVFIIPILLPWNVRGSLSLFLKWKKEKNGNELNWNKSQSIWHFWPLSPYIFCYLGSHDSLSFSTRLKAPSQTSWRLFIFLLFKYCCLPESFHWLSLCSLLWSDPIQFPDLTVIFILVKFQHLSPKFYIYIFKHISKESIGYALVTNRSSTHIHQICISHSQVMFSRSW